MAEQQELDEILNQPVSKTADASYGEWEVVGLPEAKQAILDWHNKQVEAVLDRLEGRARGAFDYEADIEEYAEDVLTSIEAERTRLRGDDE